MGIEQNSRGISWSLFAISAVRVVYMLIHCILAVKHNLLFMLPFLGVVNEGTIAIPLEERSRMTSERDSVSTLMV